MNDQLQSILGGNAPIGFGGQAAPTSQNPGGLPAPQDPAEYGLTVAIQTLKKAAQLVSLDDEKFGNDLDAMANKINKKRIERQQKIQQALATMQGRVVGSM